MLLTILIGESIQEMNLFDLLCPPNNPDSANNAHGVKSVARIM
jgi:hypothetical protein